MPLHTDCKALWESHSPKRHICGYLNQNLVVQLNKFAAQFIFPSQRADVEVNLWVLTEFLKHLKADLTNCHQV